MKGNDMTSFADHLPYGEFRKIAAAWTAKPLDEYSLAVKEGRAEKASPAEDAAWRKEFEAMEEAVAVPALASFLSALRDEGRLAPFSGADGYSTRFIGVWNEAAAGDVAGLASCFANHRRFFESYYGAGLEIEAGAEAEAAFRAGYDKLVAVFDKGDFRWFENEAERCTVSDTRVSYAIKGWAAMGGLVDTKTGALGPLPAIERPRIEELSVDFPTGELLIADWFRIDEFTAAVKERDGKSICSAAGRGELTRKYAEKHGFLSVYVGNTSPAVIARDGALVVGWESEDEPCEGEELGRVCTDLWWVTIIERARLVDIVAGTVGKEEAERIVEDYLAEHGRHIIRAEVAPGTHHLYFHPETEDFDAAFRSDDCPTAGVEAMFVLSDKRLVLTDGAAPSPGRAP
jgi:hypothetical protein